MDDLAAQVSRHVWFHSIQLADGVVTPGIKSAELHAIESAAFFDPVDLTGGTVIDIGAWNGAYSFEAKRRGATRVLATDHFAWNDPYVRGRQAFELARSAMAARGMEVESLEIDVPELSPERVGTFDVVLFLGVFYHLHDPILGLERAARLAREVLIVETALDMEDVERPAMVFYPGTELNGDPTNWWGPNAACMIALLRDLGFPTIDAARHPHYRDRGVFHAWRSPEARRSDPPEQLVLGRDRRAARLRPLRQRWRLIREAFAAR